MGRDVGKTRECQVAFGQFLAAFAFTDGNHIANLALVTGDVSDATIHSHVTMVHQLACTRHRWAEAKTEADIVQSVFQKFEQVGSGRTLLSTGFLHVAHQLALGDPVVEAEFLFFFETDRVFGALATGLAVLTGGIRPLGGLTGETWKVSQAPRNPQTRAAVSSHG